MIYDFIIIGAGIAGLYAAYNIKKKYPNKTFIILEANKKKYIGGRVHEEVFDEHLVTTGSGVGRDKKDKYLKLLLEELNIKYNKFSKDPEYSFEHVNLIKLFKELKNKFITLNKPRITFKEFALPILGLEIYKNFLRTSGYTDYENDDAEHVLYMYGFEDNGPNWVAFSVPWSELIDKLIKNVGLENIKTNTKVVKINSNNNITVYTKGTVEDPNITSFDEKTIVNDKNNEYECKKLIIATTIISLRKLLKMPIYNNIEYQSFIRIYGIVDKKSIPVMKEKVNGTLVVNNELHKIISYDTDKGLYMIGYSDNKDAIKLNKHIKNKEYFENLIKEALNIDYVKLKKIIAFFRKIGTHYYKPLPDNYTSREEFIKKAQNPTKNIFVIGEVVSENQGWVNSALGTFHKIKI
jgi:hypothetical protein